MTLVDLHALCFWQFIDGQGEARFHLYVGIQNIFKFYNYHSSVKCQSKQICFRLFYKIISQAYQFIRCPIFIFKLSKFKSFYPVYKPLSYIIYQRYQPIAEMDKPFKQITSFRSADDLREYLQQNPKLNLSNLTDKNGANLLHFASFKNDLVKMKIYFQHFKAYCEITYGNKMYETGFEQKVKSWINTPNDEGLTAVHFAALQGNVEMIMLLENLGANMEYVTNDGENVLFMAVDNNEIKTLIYLLEQSQNKLNINHKNHIGDNLLHKAARKNCVIITSYLLTKNIEMDAQNNENFTPIMEAVMAGNKEIIKSLLLKGARRDLKNNEGLKAIEIAQKDDKKEMINILNEDFTFGQKLKIACNVKIVYRVEKPTVSYELLFLFIYHLVLLPTCIITEFKAFSSDKFYIPVIIQGIYYSLTMVLFIFLTRKHPRKIPSQSLMPLELPFCAECRNQKKNEFHCFICGTCVYRYDHHCPWVNNCIGVKNIGKFYLFLWMIQIGALFVVFCHVCMLGLDKDLIQYREFTGIEPEEQAYSVLAILLALFFAVSVLLLIVGQTNNLMNNTTTFERSKKQRAKPKTSQTRSQPDTLLSEENLPNKSFLDKSDQIDSSKGCFANCRTMLCDESARA